MQFALIANDMASEKFFCGSRERERKKREQSCRCMRCIPCEVSFVFFYHHTMGRRAIREAIYSIVWIFKRISATWNALLLLLLLFVHLDKVFTLHLVALLSLATGILLLSYACVLLLPSHPHSEKARERKRKFTWQVHCATQLCNGISFFVGLHSIAMHGGVFFSSFTVICLFVRLPTFAKHRIIKCITHWELHKCENHYYLFSFKYCWNKFKIHTQWQRIYI